MIKIREVIISQLQLVRIPEPERVFLILLGHLHNELTILHKLLIYSYSDNDLDVQRKAHTCHALTIARIYIGKLFEGWQMLQKDFFRSTLSKAYEPLLPDQTRLSLKNLKDYFGRQNLIYDIRNKFSFHYSSDEVKKEMDLLKQNEYQFFISEEIANCLFYASEEIISGAMLGKINSENRQAAMDKFMKELLEVSEWFLDFTGHCVVSILSKYFSPVDFEQKEILFDAPGIHKISIPFFVTKD